MSATVAFTTPTINELSASFRVTGPLDALMYSVLPSTLSIVPSRRWACCAEAVATVNTVAKAAAVKIRSMLMSQSPKRVTDGRRIHRRSRKAKGRPGGPSFARNASACRGGFQPRPSLGRGRSRDILWIIRPPNAVDDFAKEHDAVLRADC